MPATKKLDTVLRQAAEDLSRPGRGDRTAYIIQHIGGEWDWAYAAGVDRWDRVRFSIRQEVPAAEG